MKSRYITKKILMNQMKSLLMMSIRNSAMMTWLSDLNIYRYICVTVLHIIFFAPRNGQKRLAGCYKEDYIEGGKLGG